MALSNLTKEVANDLFKMLSLNDDFTIEKIKQNYVVYSKLEIISEQIFNLKLQAENIISSAINNDFLQNIESNSKKIPGKIYYHYKINNKDILSIISPKEWNYSENYIGKYLYNYDCLFYKIID